MGRERPPSGLCFDSTEPLDRIGRIACFYPTRPMKKRSPIRVLKVGMDAQLGKSSDKLFTGVAGGAR